MSRIHQLHFFALLCAVSAFGAPERWILRNPGATQEALMRGGARTIQTITFGANEYVVVELKSRGDRSSLPVLAKTRDIYPDFPIELVAPSPAESDSRAAAWHVTKMRYTSLPSASDGRGIVVAVLDTGVDGSHPALKKRMWVNAREIPGNQIDDDQNGFVDDVNGYSFARKSGDTSDQSSHGTHCAGIIAAEPEGSALDAARGVAPGVKIMAVHIIMGTAEGFLSDAAAGIRYAVDNGAKVLSNSWRLYKSWTTYIPNDTNTALLRDAIAYAESRGALFVAAAGNEVINIDTTTDAIFPVGFKGLSNMVGVAASDSADKKASFTNYGALGVHVAAPGDGIISTVPGGGWQSMSGTSMATPLVAGVLARGLSAELSPIEAIRRLKDTSEKLTAWQSVVEAAGIIHPLRFLTP